MIRRTPALTFETRGGKLNFKRISYYLLAEGKPFCVCVFIIIIIIITIIIIIIFKSFERLSGLDMHDGTLSGGMGHRHYGIAAAGKDEGGRMALPDSILDR